MNGLQNFGVKSQHLTVCALYTVPQLTLTVKHHVIVLTV